MMTRMLGFAADAAVAPQTRAAAAVNERNMPLALLMSPLRWSLDPARGLDLGDLLVELLVVLAGRDLDLGALGSGQQPEHEAGRVDRGDAHRDLLCDMRLLATEHAQVAVGGGAVHGHRLRGLLLLLHLHGAARAERGPEEEGAGEDEAPGRMHEVLGHGVRPPARRGAQA